MTSAISRIHRKPTLVTVGERAISAHGWRLPLVEEHLRWHLGQGPSKKWCGVECMARTMFQRSSQATREMVRRRIAPAFKDFLGRGLFLTIEYKTGPNSHGEIVATKLFESESDLERDFAVHQIDRMRRLNHLREDACARALEIISQPPENAGDEEEK
jgi:hypothetical protein